MTDYRHEHEILDFLERLDVVDLWIPHRAVRPREIIKVVDLLALKSLSAHAKVDRHLDSLIHGQHLIAKFLVHLELRFNALQFPSLFTHVSRACFLILEVSDSLLQLLDLLSSIIFEIVILGECNRVQLVGTVVLEKHDDLLTRLRYSQVLLEESA